MLCVTNKKPYIEKYIKVVWCHYPHVPEKTEKLYVKISNKHSNDTRYFETTNQKTYGCRGFNKSTAGNEEMRKANIRLRTDK